MPNNEPAEDRSVRGNALKPAKVEPDQEIEAEYIGPSNISLKRNSKTITVPADDFETIRDIDPEVYSVTVVPQAVSNTIITTAIGVGSNADIVYRLENSDPQINIKIDNNNLGNDITVDVYWLYLD